MLIGMNAYFFGLFSAEALAAEGAPVELIIAPGDTFSVVGGTESSRTIEIGPYNIVVIPEAG